MVVYLTMLNLMRVFSFLYCPTNRFSIYLYYFLLNRTIFAEGAGTFWVNIVFNSWRLSESTTKTMKRTSEKGIRLSVFLSDFPLACYFPSNGGYLYPINSATLVIISSITSSRRESPLYSALFLISRTVFV